jgi:tetratricopeptide (TPR) repeat protein
MFAGLAMEHGDRVGRAEGAEAVKRLAPEVSNIEAMLALGLDGDAAVQMVKPAISWSNFMKYTGLGSTVLLQRALKAAKEAHAALDEANCAYRLGETTIARSGYVSARAHFEQALPLYGKEGSRLSEANCIRALGDIAFRCSDYDEAQLRFEEAQPLYRTADSLLGEANCILARGQLALARLDYPSALARFAEARALYEKVGSRRGEANCSLGMGRCRAAMGEKSKAAQAYEAALAGYAPLGDPYPVGAAHFLWARVCQGSESEAHRTAARAAWRRVDREAVSGLAASDGIDISELDAPPTQ